MDETTRARCEVCNEEWSSVERGIAGMECIFCRASRLAEAQLQSQIDRLTTCGMMKAKLQKQIIPALKAAGIEPKHLRLDFAFDIEVEPHGREQAMKVARATGNLTETPRKWKKEQEYQAASFSMKAPLTDQEYGPSLTIRKVDPSQNCRVEEFEETIPEHVVPERKVKRVRIVCKDAAPDVPGAAAELERDTVAEGRTADVAVPVDTEEVEDELADRIRKTTIAEE